MVLGESVMDHYSIFDMSNTLLETATIIIQQRT